MNKADTSYKYPKMTLKQNSDNCKPWNRSLHKKKQSWFRTVWLAEIICITYTSANQKYNPNRVFPRFAAATFFCCKLWLVYLFICRIFLRCHWSVLIPKLGTALLQVDETANSYPVYKSPDKFLNGQKLARIRLLFTRNPRNCARFSTANITANCKRNCTAPCKWVARVKIGGVNWVSGLHSLFQAFR